MKSENYRILLTNSYRMQDLTVDEFDSTLMHFAMLFCKEQLTKEDPPKKIQFTHGFVTKIAGDIKGGELCIVSIDGEDLHPVNLSILALNLGFESSKELVSNYPDDFDGWIINNKIIKK